MKMKTSKKSLMELNYILYAREAKETISYCWYIVLVATISFVSISLGCSVALGPLTCFISIFYSKGFLEIVPNTWQVSVDLKSFYSIYFNNNYLVLGNSLITITI